MSGPARGEGVTSDLARRMRPDVRHGFVRTSFKSCFVGLTLAWLTSAGLASVTQDGPKADRRTVWDGVYSAEQADRGKTIYTQSCAGCHSADLRGDGTAPSLVEGDFTFQWADTSLGELYERIRTLMPSTRPNSLPPRSYVDIVAYILRANQFPAGPNELAPELATLKQIQIAAKP